MSDSNSNSPNPANVNNINRNINNENNNDNQFVNFNHENNKNVHPSTSDRQLRHHVEQRHLELYRQNSIKKPPRVVRNDLESKINRTYSKLLVDYHWLFLVVGVLISIVLTGVSFVKQPLPNFLDPKRGFGARGEGTLTSQLIVMKNVNVEIMKYNKYILDLYEQIKKSNKSSDFFNEDEFMRQHSVDDPVNQEAPDEKMDEHTDQEDADDEDDETEQEKEEPNKAHLKTSQEKKDENNSGEYDQFDYSSESTNSTSIKNRHKRQAKSSPSSFTNQYESIKHDLASTEHNIKFDYDAFMRQIIHRKLTTQDILKMMPYNLTISDESKYFSNHVLNRLEVCNYTLGSDTNLELYFSASSSNSFIKLVTSESQYSELAEKYNRTVKTTHQFNTNGTEFIDMNSEYSIENDPYLNYTQSYSDKISYLKTKEENLLNLEKLRSLCIWDKKMLKLLLKPNNDQTVCYFSLPKSIAIMNNKTDCMDLTANDVRNFLNIIYQCRPLYESGVLFAAAEEHKQKSEIFKLLDKNKPISSFVKLPTIKNNICFKNNMIYIIFDYIIDKDFMSNSSNVNIKTSSLLILNSQNDSKIVPNTARKFNYYKHRNENKLFNENYLYDVYLKHFHKERYDDQVTTLIGINLMGIRQEAAMRFISQEMMLVALAITLIVIVTLLYLKSIFISMIVNFGVAMSVGVSFFAYRIVFDIDLFPFINMMAAFLLIGIACDDVYVLFDSWYNEKAKVIMEDLPDMIEKQYKGNNNTNSQTDTTIDDRSSNQQSNDQDSSLILPPIFIKRRFYTNKEKKQRKNRSNNLENASFLNLDELNNPNSNNNNNSSIIIKQNAELSCELIEKGIDINDYELNPAYVRLAPLSDEQMIRVMGGTLRHAAMSIFVTSFTTAAAFLTNFITKLPYVQLFGVFTGTCILVYFCMVITMVAAFVISYEKYIQPFRCKVSTRLTQKLEDKFQKIMDYMALLNFRVISQNLPTLIIKFRVLFFISFFLLGIAGMLAVFYKPQLKPPANWRYQFFKNGNLFEGFEFNVKDQFWSYVNEEKRNLTNPEIYFIFGIIDKDNGRIFNPDDDGHLIYDTKFDFLSKESQVWLHKFIIESIANRRDLFLVDDIVKEWKKYLLNMQQICLSTLGIDEDNWDKKLYLPYDPHRLAKCRDEISQILINSTVENFENLMASFPRQIIFMANGKDVNAILLRVKANRTFFNHDAVRDYYLQLKDFHKDVILDKAPNGFNTGWFISVAFALYDLQYQLITGTYSSLVASMAIALIILLLTSGNIIISLFAIITISFSIADTIAIFVFLGWDLSILESVIIIMSVGLSVDFSCHYGVAYINCDTDFSSLYSRSSNNSETSTNLSIKDRKHKKNKKCSFLQNCTSSYKRNNKERFLRIHDIFERVGSAVLMAAFTTFLAGFSMFPSGLVSFGKMGEFLMLVMCFSYLYATFFFVPMCALFGPTKNFGNLRLKECFLAIWNGLTCCLNKNKKNDKSINNNNNIDNSSTNKRLIYNNNNNDDSNNKLLVNANILNSNEAQL